MARIIFVNVPAHGHTNPTLPLVRELVQRGESVIYYSFDVFQHAIEQTGATFRSYQHLLSLDYTRPDPNLFRLATTLLDATATLLPSLLDSVTADAPDLIIYDSLCPWGKYVAQLLACPAICSTTTFALTPRLALGSLTQIVELIRMYFTAHPQRRQFHAIARTLGHTYGLPQPQPLDMFRNEAELNLVYTSAEFQPAGASFSSRFKFVGPSLAPPEVDTPLPFPLPTNTPVLYISLGTLFNEDISFYRTCFDTFASMSIYVIMSVGAKVSVEQLGHIPANFTVRQSVPQLAVLRHAQVFITHGGMNSVHEALFLGVPMVVIPQAADQHFVAQRIHAVRAGIRLNRKQLSQRTLRQAVERVLSNPAYRAASHAVGASLRRAGGYARAAHEINEFKQAKQIA